LDTIIDGIWEATPKRLVSIREEVSRLGNLIGDLRNLAKFDSETNKIYKTNTNYKGSINIAVHEEDDAINIVVKDNGIGIPKEDLNYIFERFYRVDKSRNKETGGIGVGLTIAKSIANAHEGDIIVNSELNKGTEFIIKLRKL
jgi:signal transduction histidine kinase